MVGKTNLDKVPEWLDAEVGVQNWDLVFWYFAISKSEFWVPKTEIPNFWKFYRILNTESWMGTWGFLLFWVFWKAFQSILKAFQSFFFVLSWLAGKWDYIAIMYIAKETVFRSSRRRNFEQMAT